MKTKSNNKIDNKIQFKFNLWELDPLTKAGLAGFIVSCNLLNKKTEDNNININIINNDIDFELDEHQFNDIMKYRFSGLKKIKSKNSDKESDYIVSECINDLYHESETWKNNWTNAENYKMSANIKRQIYGGNYPITFKNLLDSKKIEIKSSNSLLFQTYDFCKNPFHGDSKKTFLLSFLDVVSLFFCIKTNSGFDTIQAIPEPKNIKNFVNNFIQTIGLLEDNSNIIYSDEESALKYYLLYGKIKKTLDYTMEDIVGIKVLHLEGSRQNSSIKNILNIYSDNSMMKKYQQIISSDYWDPEYKKLRIKNLINNKSDNYGLFVLLNKSMFEGNGKDKRYIITHDIPKYTGLLNKGEIDMEDNEKKDLEKIIKIFNSTVDSKIRKSLKNTGGSDRIETKNRILKEIYFDIRNIKRPSKYSKWFIDFIKDPENIVWTEEKDLLDTKDFLIRLSLDQNLIKKMEEYIGIALANSKIIKSNNQTNKEIENE